MRGTPKGWEPLRQNGYRLPSWVAKALDGGTESPLRLRRCPPFRKGGCCYASSGSLVKGSWHGEAVTEGFRTPVVPLIRHGLRPCHLLPCGAKAITVLSGALKCRWPSPHPSRLTPCHLPPGESIVRVNLAFPLPGGRWPAGPDEGGYRWVRRPSNGRMGTSAPTQGYDRFRRGRCPQRPVDNGCTPVVPLIRHGCAMPPSPLRGEGFGLYFRRCSNVDGVPLIRHGLRPCHLPLGEGFLQCIIPSLFRQT